MEYNINKIAENVLQKYNYKNKIFYLIIDDEYSELGNAIKNINKGINILYLSDFSAEDLLKQIKRTEKYDILLFADPQTFIKNKLYLILDFSDGEPKIQNINSRVFIFPKESIYHIFSADPEEDIKEKYNLLNKLKNNRKYIISSETGTHIEFTARQWIPLDFEICTAPVEETIHGRIVVDGAVFFRRNQIENGEKIIIDIENGKIKNIEPFDEHGIVLATEYRKMIASSIEDPVNMQLAEIGIGFCHGAEISDCFMEAETVFGTCHFCFGNNVCYGGNNASSFHGNSVLIQDPHLTYSDTK